MSETTALEATPPKELTLRSLIKSPQVTARFQEVLGLRAPQFISSVISVGNTLGLDCEPMSIVAAAMTAATLDLPVDKNLGFAWIVPFKRHGVKYAQFQMGYKGFIQLAIRSGQYERMNARAINEEAFGGWDDFGEPRILWDKVDETKPVVGYAFTFKLVKGFVKTAYWTKARVEEHARKYSQSFRSGYDSPWKSHFDQMALKTVVKNELNQWGVMSIQLNEARVLDQSVKRDLDAEPEYIDVLDNPETVAPKFSTEGKAALFPEESTPTTEAEGKHKKAKS